MEESEAERSRQEGHTGRDDDTRSFVHIYPFDLRTHATRSREMTLPAVRVTIQERATPGHRAEVSCCRGVGGSGGGGRVPCDFIADCRTFFYCRNLLNIEFNTKHNKIMGVF